MITNLDKRILRKKLQFQNRISKVPILGATYFFNFTEEGERLKNMLLHKKISKYPDIEFKVTRDIKPTEADLKLTKRLLIAYKKSILDSNMSSREDMWTFLAKGPHRNFFELLKKENIQEIAFYLCNMSRMEITHGITQGKIEFNKIKSDSVYKKWLGLFTLSKVISLAEALGVIPLEGPEQGEFGAVIHSNVNKIIKKIEDFLRISIFPPEVEGGLYKLVTKSGRLHSRDVTSLYTAWKCRELLKDIKNPSVCEIGAGIGKTAYYSNLFGIEQYTIIDLPYINILQGFYLIKSLPRKNIYLYGEKILDKNSILIFPDFSFSKISGKVFDLSLNQDSFPEIDRETVLNYLTLIKLHTKKLFLTINQEAQHTMMVSNLKQHFIPELISQSKGFKKIHRIQYWLRIGYVEELYEIS